MILSNDSIFERKSIPIIDPDFEPGGDNLRRRRRASLPGSGEILCRRQESLLDTKKQAGTCCGARLSIDRRGWCYLIRLANDDGSRLISQRSSM